MAFSTLSLKMVVRRTTKTSQSHDEKLFRCENFRNLWVQIFQGIQKEAIVDPRGPRDLINRKRHALMSLEVNFTNLLRHKLSNSYSLSEKPSNLLSYMCRKNISKILKSSSTCFTWSWNLILWLMTLNHHFESLLWLTNPINSTNTWRQFNFELSNKVWLGNWLQIKS